MSRPPQPRPTPRLSAAQLADYLAASTVLAQLGILRNAKYPGDARPLLIQYQDARKTISAALVAPENRHRVAAASISELGQRRDDPANKPLIRDDARRCIDVIETFLRSVNALDLANVRFEACPGRSAALAINGVEISVVPDATVIAGTRNGDRVGQLFIRCATGEEGEAAEGRRSESNLHLAVLAHMHAVNTLAHRGTPHGPTSLVLDVRRERVVRGPANSTMRVRNIEAACGVIAALWPTI